MRELQGRVAVITGAASGIGKAVASSLAEAGMSVVLADFEEDALRATAQELLARELDVFPVYADVSQQQSMVELRDRVVERYGAVHVLMNNAGVADAARVPIWESADSDWDWVFKINFWGVLNGIRAFVPGMIEGGQEGHIINTASVAGLIPANGIYGISKHAVVALSESLRAGLDAHGASIGVSVLCPPLVKTRIFESSRNRPGAGATSLASTELLQRAIDVDVISDAVLQGIYENQFYVVPPSEFDAVFKQRFQDIIERNNP